MANRIRPAASPASSASGASSITRRSRSTAAATRSAAAPHGEELPEIAARLELRPETVRTYAKAAMRKLSARTRPHAVAPAHRRGEISLEALAAGPRR